MKAQSHSVVVKFGRNLGLTLLLTAVVCASPILASGQTESPLKNSATPTPSNGSASAKKDIQRLPPSALSQGENKEKRPSPPPRSYVIGVEDELQISVWRERELSIQVVVRPDGMISVPLLNDIEVNGLTPMELQALLSEKLKDFVTEPQVTVIVRRIRSRKVYLVGAVVQQGAVLLNGEKTVLQLLAEAGGFGPFAKTDSIYVLRNHGGRRLRIPFNYKKVVKGQDRAKDITLLPGDVVIVP